MSQMPIGRNFLSISIRGISTNFGIGLFGKILVDPYRGFYGKKSEGSVQFFLTKIGW